MKLKKLVKVLLSCVVAGALFTGCGDNGGQPADDSSASTVKFGMMSLLNSDEKSFGDILAAVEEQTGLNNTRHLPKFYDSLKTMQMSIDAGAIEEISLYKSVAGYLVAKNDKYELVPNNALNKISYSFCFAVRQDDEMLKDELNKVIDEMKADGTLDVLIDEYITNVDKGKDIPAVKISTIDGAQKIKVGVTGDLPPLDLVLADNSPAGFNTAMLAEIAKRLGKNVEIVQIESGARAAALSSKVIDVAFWAVVPFGIDGIPSDIDEPDGTDLSTPYFRDNVAHIRLKDKK